MSAPVPTYVMKCPNPKCGLEWHTTRAVPDRKDMACRSIDLFTLQSMGCGKRLPMPVPEEG